MKEGSLEAPTRHPIDWKNPEYHDEPKIVAEMERVFDICHGCRRCVSLCNTFPRLFDYVDGTDTGEVEAVPNEKFWDVVDQCYLCDMCYMVKCHTSAASVDVDFLTSCLPQGAQVRGGR